MSQFWNALTRPRNLCAIGALLFVFALHVLKTSWVSDYSQKKAEFVQANNERVFNLFQGSFYFYYEDQFKPAVEDFLEKNPDLKRIIIISSSGQVAFDSKDLGGQKTVPYKIEDSLATRPSTTQLLSDPEGVGVLQPSGQYSIYYVFSTSAITLRVGIIFLCGIAFFVALWFVLDVLKFPVRQRVQKVLATRVKIYSLRAKFVAAIILVNLLTGTIIFISQSHTQKKEQTERIVNMSVILAELSKEHLISSFSNFFYFYYQDKFVPTIKQFFAQKENLTHIRIISRKSGMVVFDSEDLQSGKQPVPGIEGKKSNLTDEVLAELRQRDTFHQVIHPRNGDPYIQVVTTYRNENEEAPFYVEYLFSFATLRTQIRAIRKQIVLELIPSILLGVMIGIIFAQLVVGPIRKLVDATRAITGGNYDITVDTKKKDELGDLMRAFNGMAVELKRKNELKKFLSGQSYRKIVEEANQAGIHNAGSRVRATVLFCDIRNFVNVCEALDAEEVTSLLNDYFSNMVEVIYKHKGEVDKFIGDAILAVFYEQDDAKYAVNTALHAIYCGMEMRERLNDFNAKRVRMGKPTIEIGIGINSGEIISGPIGSPDRMDFTVIGDVVNLASRIEKMSKQGRHTRIVFSQRVETRIRGLLDYEELSREKIRGKEEEVTVYELIKIKDVAELLSNLSSPDPHIKRHCIELLGYSRNPQALQALYQKLSDSNDSVRIAAVAAMTRLAPKDHAETLEIMFSHLEQETSEKVISTLLISIGKLCKSNKILRIARFLQHSDERIVANTIEALGATDDPQVIDLLIPFVSSKNNRVKANAAMVLFSKGRVEVLDVLKPMLLHSDPLMRASAAFALGELTVLSTAEEISNRIKNDGKFAKHLLGELQGTVALLVSLLKDKDPIVKRQAIIALGKVKDKSAVLPLLDNINIDNDSKELVHDVAEALRSIGSHRLVREVVRQLS